MYSFHNPGACARAKHNMCTAQDHQRAQGRARSQHVAAVKHSAAAAAGCGTARSEREVRGAGEGYTAADGAKPATPEKRMPHAGRLRNTLAL